MKGVKVSMIASVIAIALFAFTSAPKAIGIGTNCADQLVYFPVNSSSFVDCSEVTTAILDFSTTPVADNDANLEPNEYVLRLSDDRPFGCEDVPEVACTVGYSTDQLVYNASLQKWIPSATATPKCCIRKAE